MADAMVGRLVEYLDYIVVAMSVEMLAVQLVDETADK